ncbi:hypothetical protein J3E61_006804 [Mycobacterium sp. OAE908]|uniref:hypothetical protein n=1 Tax=Mycobacterium sp. OAE908 TaxID=2817899 RepID=UPI0034E1ADBF
MNGGAHAQDPARALGPLRGHAGESGHASFTIKDVGAACGLPGPVIAQLVPRTWVDGVGWMYTGEQVAASIVLGENLRRFLAWTKAGVYVRCETCGAEPADAVDAAGWVLRDDAEPQGFCPEHRPQEPSQRHR